MQWRKLVVPVAVAVLVAVAWSLAFREQLGDARRTSVHPRGSEADGTASAASEPQAAPSIAVSEVVASPRVELDTVGERGVVRGAVVDAEGRPIEGVSVTSTWEPTLLDPETTDAEGRFQLKVLDDSDTSDHVSVLFSHARYRTTRTWLHVGGNDVRIVLQPAVEVNVTIVDEHGAAVAVRGIKVGDRFSDEVVFEAAGTGWRAFLEPRAYPLLVIDGLEGQKRFRPEMPKRLWEPLLGWLQVEEPGPMTIQVTIAKLAKRRVRVVDHEGRGLADAAVSMQMSEPPLSAAGRSGNVAPVSAADAQDLAWQAFDSGATDDDGRITLCGPLGRPATLCVEPRTSCHPMVVPFDVGVQEELIVRIDRARLRGRVLAEPVRRLLFRDDMPVLPPQPPPRRFVYLEGKDHEVAGQAMVDANGVFEFNGVLPGQYGVGFGWGGIGESRTVHAGDNPPLTIDLRSESTSVQLRVTGCDEHCGAWLFVSRVDSAPDERRVSAVLDRMTPGVFEGRLLVGTYQVEHRGALVEGAIFEVSELPPNSRLVASVDVPMGDLVLKLVDAAGQPARGQRLMVLPASGAVIQPHDCADAAGVLRVRLPAGSWVPTWTDDRVLDWSGFDLNDGPYDSSVFEGIVKNDGRVWERYLACRRPLEAVTVRAGETTVVTRVMPDEAMRQAAEDW